MFERQNRGLDYDLQIKAPRKGPSAYILSHPERADGGEVALGKVHLHLILSGFDVLKAKLQSGVSIGGFLRSYGDRANDLPTVTKCTFHSVHFMSLVLTDACYVDIQEHFAELSRRCSSGRRHFYVHRLPSTVRPQLPVLRSRAKGETVITIAGLGRGYCTEC